MSCRVGLKVGEFKALWFRGSGWELRTWVRALGLRIRDFRICRGVESKGIKGVRMQWASRSFV